MRDPAHYGLAAERGYLSATEIDTVALPADFAAIEEAAATLPALVATGAVRRFLDRLPMPGIDRFPAGANEAETGAAMVRYSFLVRAYV